MKHNESISSDQTRRNSNNAMSKMNKKRVFLSKKRPFFYMENFQFLENCLRLSFFEKASGMFRYEKMKISGMFRYAEKKHAKAHFFTLKLQKRQK